MAYTFQDPYRPIRWLLRWSGLVIGLGLGGLLLALPGAWLDALGLPSVPLTWVVRAGGSGLLGMGVARLMAAQEMEPGRGLLVGVLVGDAILAGVIFLAYFQGQLDRLSAWGQGGILLVFGTCLADVITVLAFLRSVRRV